MLSGGDCEELSGEKLKREGISDVLCVITWKSFKQRGRGGEVRSADRIDDHAPCCVAATRPNRESVSQCVAAIREIMKGRKSRCIHSFLCGRKKEADL